jgi:ribonuclease P protein component
MLDDLRAALHRLDRQAPKPSKAFSTEADTGSRKQNASKTDTSAGRQPN